MAFTRKFLADHGVPEDQIDAIMAERSRTLTDYIPKSDVQAQIDAAIAEAQKGWKPDITETAEYKDLKAKYDMRVALDGDEYSSVKPKFREAVYNMIDRREGAKPFEEQLTAVKEKYEEYFVPSQSEAKPQFSGEMKGSMPQGTGKPTLEDLWGYNKKH